MCISPVQNLETQVKDLSRQLQASKDTIQRLEQENMHLKAELAQARGTPFGMMKPATVGGVSALMVC